MCGCVLAPYDEECLTQAHRKAPSLANGFSLELVKWITVVRLLLGEIPEKKAGAVTGERGEGPFIFSLFIGSGASNSSFF